MDFLRPKGRLSYREAILSLKLQSMVALRSQYPRRLAQELVIRHVGHEGKRNDQRDAVCEDLRNVNKGLLLNLC